jgi:hypothetical protein
MRIYVLFTLSVLLAFCSQPQPQPQPTSHSPTRPSSVVPANGEQSQASETGEYLAWEKVFDDAGNFRYKQVRKNYFLNRDLCRNVISVLAETSHHSATYSEFECWPASTNPNEYYEKYSVHSDVPDPVILPTVK